MLSRAVASVFFEEHRPPKLPIHMQESRATAAYHVNAIAAQQVALQHVTRQSRCLSGPVY